MYKTKITIEINVPDSFDPIENVWEIEKAAQALINDTYEIAFEQEEKENGT